MGGHGIFSAVCMKSSLNVFLLYVTEGGKGGRVVCWQLVIVFIHNPLNILIGASILNTVLSFG